MNKSTLLYLAILLSLACEVVIAAGFQLQERSTRGLGRAFSGEAAIADDASVIASNPAGMTLLQDNSFSAGLTYIDPNNDVNGSTESGPVDDNEIAPTAFVPNFYFSKKYSDKIVFGLGSFTPYGLKTDYSDIFASKAVTNLSSLETINFNPSIAYRINEQWSVGVGFNVLYAKKAKITGNAVSSANVPSNFSVKGDGWGFGYNIGILYEINKGTRFGLHFRSKIDITLSGDYRGSFSGGATVREKVKFELPATLEFSVLHEFNEQWSLHGDVVWTDWSSFETLATSSQTEINNSANWKDAVRLSIGTTYKYNEKLVIRSGFAYDDSPIRSAKYRTLRIPDDDRYWLSFGASYQFYKNYHLDLAYTHIFINKKTSINEPMIGNGIFTGTAKGEVNLFAIGISGSF